MGFLEYVRIAHGSTCCGISTNIHTNANTHKEWNKERERDRKKIGLGFELSAYTIIIIIILE